jgi:hypothetical protein
MKPISTRIVLFLAAGVLSLLAGCATTYTLDNTVQSFSQLPALPQPATYRFERLPSQQDLAQPQLEAMADAALNAAGLRRDDASPRFSVQITARTERTLSPFADPWDRFGWGWGAWGGRRHWGMGMYGYSNEPSWFHREVNVVVRDLGNNRVVYESRAVSDAPYYESEKVFPAMFAAAMQGFPNPPAGPRKVNVQIPNT